MLLLKGANYFCFCLSITGHQMIQLVHFQLINNNTRKDLYIIYLQSPLIPCVLTVFANDLNIPSVSNPRCACIFVLIVSNGCPTATLVVPQRTPTNLKFFFFNTFSKIIYQCHNHHRKLNLFIYLFTSSIAPFNIYMIKGALQLVSLPPIPPQGRTSTTQ